MKLNLIVAKGKRKGKIIPVAVPQFVIGRHKECHLKANGSTISQHHCAVLVRDGKVFIRDFDSTTELTSIKSVCGTNRSWRRAMFLSWAGWRFASRSTQTPENRRRRP